MQFERDDLGEDEVVLVQVVQVVHLLGAGCNEDVFFLDGELDLERACLCWLDDHLGLTDIVNGDHSFPDLN